MLMVALVAGDAMREKAALYLTHVRTVLGGSPIRVGYVLTGLWLVALAIYITFGNGLRPKVIGGGHCVAANVGYGGYSD